MTYSLIDAVQRAAEYPDTWEPCDTSELSEGQFVKLVFVSPVPLPSPFCPAHTIDTERMWVLIREIKEDGTLVGVLDNNPAAFPADVLKLGDTVTFERKNICAKLDPPKPGKTH